MDASKMQRVVVLAGLLATLGCQPRDETPGLWLRGVSAEQRVDDWIFTDDIEEIFIETRPWYVLPHSTTIWCVELDGELYIGSYGDERKTWEGNVARNPVAKLSIAGMLYEVTVKPETGPGRIERLDEAYARKYDMAEVFGDELPEWRYYRVVQRKAADR
jgi:hypothetical protein